MAKSGEIGWLGELCAQLLLKNNGYIVTEKNYRSKRQTGEIDIIATRKDILVFVEVKVRRSSRYGAPDEFVDEKKRTRLRKTAEEYIQTEKLKQSFYRFDIVAIDCTKREVRWLQNAFGVRQ